MMTLVVHLVRTVPSSKFIQVQNEGKLLLATILIVSCFFLFLCLVIAYIPYSFVLNVICMSIVWQLAMTPSQVELSELLQAITEECRKIIEMDRKRVTLQRLVKLSLPCVKNRDREIVFLINLTNLP